MGLTKAKITNIDTSTFRIDDPIISMNAGLDPANPNNTDIGILMKRGTTGDNVAFMWDKTGQEFILATTTADDTAVGDLVYTGYADLQCKDITSSTLTTSGIITATGSASPVVELKPNTSGGYPQVRIKDSNNIVRGYFYIAEADGSVSIRRDDASGNLLTVVTLSTDGNLAVSGGAPISPNHLTRKDYVDGKFSNGVSGTFTTADNKTVTVTNGLITSIV